MPTDDTYQGWSNRETWAVNLWLSNAEGTQSMVNERIDALRPKTDPDWLSHAVADMLHDLTEELLDPTEALLDPGTRDTMLRDIGSLWRVDWRELAEAWLAE